MLKKTAREGIDPLYTQFLTRVSRRARSAVPELDLSAYWPLPGNRDPEGAGMAVSRLVRRGR